MDELDEHNALIHVLQDENAHLKEKMQRIINHAHTYYEVNNDEFCYYSEIRPNIQMRDIHIKILGVVDTGERDKEWKQNIKDFLRDLHKAHSITSAPFSVDDLMDVGIQIYGAEDTMLAVDIYDDSFTVVSIRDRSEIIVESENQRLGGLFDSESDDDCGPGEMLSMSYVMQMLRELIAIAKTVTFDFRE
jgi:hypothetical protein